MVTDHTPTSPESTSGDPAEAPYGLGLVSYDPARGRIRMTTDHLDALTHARFPDALPPQDPQAIAALHTAWQQVCTAGLAVPHDPETAPTTDHSAHQGTSSGEEPLRGGLLVARGAVDLPGEEEPPDGLCL